MKSVSNRSPLRRSQLQRPAGTLLARVPYSSASRAGWATWGAWVSVIGVSGGVGGSGQGLAAARRINRLRHRCFQVPLSISGEARRAGSEAGIEPRPVHSGPASSFMQRRTTKRKASLAVRSPRRAEAHLEPRCPTPGKRPEGSSPSQPHREVALMDSVPVRILTVSPPPPSNGPSPGLAGHRTKPFPFPVPGSLEMGPTARHPHGADLVESAPHSPRRGELRWIDHVDSCARLLRPRPRNSASRVRGSQPSRKHVDTAATGNFRSLQGRHPRSGQRCGRRKTAPILDPSCRRAHPPPGCPHGRGSGPLAQRRITRHGVSSPERVVIHNR